MRASKYREQGRQAVAGGKPSLSSQQRLAQAAQELARVLPLDRIDVAKVARKAKVSRPTASRYLGNKQRLREQLVQANPALARGSSTRDRLMAAAEQVFARYGFAAATLDEVGRRVGASKAAVYQHFASKDELFLALLEAHDAALASSAPPEIAAAFATLPPSEALARVLALQLQRMAANQDYVRLYVEFLAASRKRVVRDRLRASHRRQTDILVSLVRELMAGGVLVASTPVESVARILLVLLDGFTLQSLVVEWRSDEVAEQVAGLLLHGLLPWLRSGPAEGQ